MKDSELRGLVLQRLYEQRRRGQMHLTANNPPLNESLPFQETLRICKQLEQHGLVMGTFHRSLDTRDGEYDFGTVEITAHGIDVIEDNRTTEIKIEFVQTKNISISGSSNVIVGNDNKMEISSHITQLARAIELVDAPAEQKQSALKLLKQFSQHPLVATIVGAALGGVFAG